MEGQWKLKITSVTPTAERNQFSEDKPVQVVVINYTYENLGYTSDAQDLFLTPSNVIDEGKKFLKLIRNQHRLVQLWMVLKLPMDYKLKARL